MSKALFVTSSERPPEAKIVNKAVAPSVTNIQNTSKKELATLEKYSGMKITNDADLKKAKLGILKKKNITISSKKLLDGDPYSGIERVKETTLGSTISDPYKRSKITKELNELTSDGISPSIVKKIANETGLDDRALDAIAKSHGVGTSNIIKKAASGDTIGAGIDISKRAADKLELGLKAKDSCPDTSFSCPWFDLSGLKMDLNLSKYAHAVGDMLHKAISMMDGSMFGNIIRCASYIAAKGIGHVNKLAKVVGETGNTTMLGHVAKSVKLYYGDDHSVIAKVPGMDKHVRVASGNGGIQTEEQKQATLRLFQDMDIDGYALVSPTDNYGNTMQLVDSGSSASEFDSDSLNELVYGESGKMYNTKDVVRNNSVKGRSLPSYKLLRQASETINANPAAAEPEPADVVQPILQPAPVVDPFAGYKWDEERGGYFPTTDESDDTSNDVANDDTEDEVPDTTPIPATLHNHTIEHIGMATATLRMADTHKIDVITPSIANTRIAPGKVSMYRNAARATNGNVANKSKTMNSVVNVSGDMIIQPSITSSDTPSPVSIHESLRDQFIANNGVLKGDIDIDACSSRLSMGMKESDVLNNAAVASFKKNCHIPVIKKQINTSFDKKYAGMYIA